MFFKYVLYYIYIYIALLFLVEHGVLGSEEFNC